MLIEFVAEPQAYICTFVRALAAARPTRPTWAAACRLLGRLAVVGRAPILEDRSLRRVGRRAEPGGHAKNVARRLSVLLEDGVARLRSRRPGRRLVLARPTVRRP